MILPVLRRLLRWTGRDHLVPFLDGLIGIGRPATVHFPSELLEQGFSLIVSGLNNTMAIQSNPRWVWPYWVERQIDPEAPEFAPTAMNLMMNNLSHRDWTSIGLAGSPRESMVDPVGMLTLRPFGWSVFPYLRLGDRGFLPPRMHGRVRQSLLESVLPAVETTYLADPRLSWKSQAMALAVGGEETILFSHALQNRSPEAVEAIFGLAIRPYNPLMIGHINRLRYKNRLWRVNGRPGLLLLDDPHGVTLSDRHHGDPLVEGAVNPSADRLASRSGIACATAEWRVRLAPGDHWRLDTLGTLEKIARRPDTKFRAIDRAGVDQAREAELRRWRANLERGLVLELPEKSFQTAFDAIKNHLHVFDDGDRFTPGTFLYHGHWFRDGAFLALAHENLGWTDEVRRKILRFPQLQGRDGLFRSQNGEWDSNGQALWTMGMHFRRSSSPDALLGFYPSMLRAARWIEGRRAETQRSLSPHFGLLPAGFSAEHFGPNDHYYWDNFWNLAGLRAVLWCALRLGSHRDAQWLRDLSEDYRSSIVSSMGWAVERVGGLRLPSSPYRWMDSAAIGGLVAANPLALFPPDEPWIRATAEDLVDSNLRDGLFFQRIVHTGLNPYLSAQLARALMALGDPRWFEILEALLRAASPTLTWPEALHPGGYGGCMGDGDHGWSAAETLNLLRDIVVREQGRELLLCDGMPERWIQPGARIAARRAATDFGVVDIEMRCLHTVLEVEWTLRRQPHQDEPALFLSLPMGILQDPRPGRRHGSRLRLPLSGERGRIQLSLRGAAARQPALSNQETP